MLYVRKFLSLSITLALVTQSSLVFAGSNFTDNFIPLKKQDGITYGDENEDGEFDDSLEDFYGDEEFISIATGTKKAIHKAPSVATVITADEIQSMGANSIYEILETVTGIHIYPSNLDRMKPNFSIRGIHTPENPQTLLLVDGTRVAYEYTGSRWEQFNIGVNLIDRIEVIKGPGSAVYGADAFSGVINIITKGINTTSKLEAGVKLGSFNLRSSWMNYVNVDNELKYSLSGQWSKSDGDNNRIVTQDAMSTFGLDFLSLAPRALDTQYRMLDLHGQLSYKNLYSSVWYLNNRGGTGAGAAQALSNRDVEKVDSITLKLGYKWELPNSFDFDFSTYYQSYNDDTYFMIYPPGMALPRTFNEQGIPTAFTVFTEGLIGQPVAHEKHLGANFIMKYTGLAEHQIRTEFGYRHTSAKQDEYKNFGLGVLNGTEDFKDATLVNVRGTPHIYMNDQKRELYFFTIQDEWQLASDWELTSGLRFDEYSDFGSTVNPRVALVWQTKHNLTTKLLYGAAFRAPSFQELYAINNPVVLGNETLMPEEINTFELSFDYRLNFDWKFLANIFSYKANKMIIWVPNGDGTNTAQNKIQQDGYGVEFETHWKVNDQLHLKAGYAWQASKNSDSGDSIADAPSHMYDLSIDYSINDLVDIRLISMWINGRQRVATDNRENIANFSTTNLSLIYRANDSVDFQFSIRNLFDENIREASDGQITEDYPMAGRGAWLSLSFSI